MRWPRFLIALLIAIAGVMPYAGNAGAAPVPQRVAAMHHDGGGGHHRSHKHTACHAICIGCAMPETAMRAADPWSGPRDAAPVMAMAASLITITTTLDPPPPRLRA
jgi:hypothetical protein